jgi:hypothetical protein
VFLWKCVQEGLGKGLAPRYILAVALVALECRFSGRNLRRYGLLHVPGFILRAVSRVGFSDRGSRAPLFVGAAQLGVVCHTILTRVLGFPTSGYVHVEDIIRSVCRDWWLPVDAHDVRWLIYLNMMLCRHWSAKRSTDFVWGSPKYETLPLLVRGVLRTARLGLAQRSPPGIPLFDRVKSPFFWSLVGRFKTYPHKLRECQDHDFPDLPNSMDIHHMMDIHRLVSRSGYADEHAAIIELGQVTGIPASVLARLTATEAIDLALIAPLCIQTSEVSVRPAVLLLFNGRRPPPLGVQIVGSGVLLQVFEDPGPQ